MLDLEDTVDEIIKASVLPLSIIIVGLGNDDFTRMEELDSDSQMLYSKRTNQRAARDIVQFVPFRTFYRDPIKLATETLKEVPRQFSEYAEIAHLSLEHVDNVNGMPYFEKKKQEFINNCKAQLNEDMINAINKGIPVDSIAYLGSTSICHYFNPLV